MKHLKKIGRLLVVLVLLVALGANAFTGFSAYGATMSELQNERNELQSQLKDIEASIAAIENEQDRLEQRIATLRSRTDIVQAQINICLETIEITQTELLAKQQELDQKERDIDETFELFKQRLRAMYMSEDSSLLAVFLQSSTITEFFTNAEAMRRVSKHDNELIDRLKVEKAEIETAKLEIEADLEVLEAEKAELDSAYNEMAVLLREANSALSEQQALKNAKQAEQDKIEQAFQAVEDEIAELAAQSGGSFIGGQFRWPLPGYPNLSYGFGYRVDPITGAAGDFHRGIDITGWNVYGKPVIASNSGRVVKAEYTSTGYGIYVIIDHGGGVSTVYAHLSAITVTKGQYVYQGDQVGKVGSTGNSSGPHLHFSVYINGYAQNPLNYVSYAW